MGKTEFIDNPADLYAILNSDDIDLSTLREVEINEKLMQLHYKCNDKYVQNNYNTNVFIATFTTSWARIRLYEALDYLGEQVLYYDIDSVIF